MEIHRSIEIFLEKNNLAATLQFFKQEQNKPTSNPAAKFAQLATIHKFCLNAANAQDVRDHFQKTDPAPLKRALNKLRRKQHQASDRSDINSLSKLPFFQKLLNKQNENSNTQDIEPSFSDLRQSRSVACSLEESRVIDNVWDSQDAVGFETFSCSASDLQKTSEELCQLKNFGSKQQIDYDSVVKPVAFPKQYYEKQEALINRVGQNYFDKKRSKLPTKIRFCRDEGQDIYPLEDSDATYDSFSLKVVYDRQKTGFEQERELPIVINQVLAGRYQVIALLAQAVFSKAIEVKDLTNNRNYCIKIIQNNKGQSSKEYFDQSIDEIKLLRYIGANCNTDDSHLLTLHDYFYHKEHLMLVTELLNDNLYDAYRMHPKHFNLKLIQTYSHQILTALQRLHSLHIIHADLKPQNILIKSFARQEVKVIDIGSGIFLHDQQNPSIQTICYRAPEVILGCPYDDKIDIWSFGCIIAELFQSEVLFGGESEAGMLAQMQGLRGPWPSWMLETGTEVKKYFTNNLVIHEQVPTDRKNSSKVDGDSFSKNKNSFKIYVPIVTNLKSRLKTDHKTFIDFLSKCLKLDPTVRMSAKEALKHPFLLEKLD